MIISYFHGVKYRYEKWIHVFLWLVFVLALFGAFGQRIRILETPEGIAYSFSYDYTLLIILIFDVASKVLMFYANLNILSARKTVNPKSKSAKRFRLAAYFIGTQVLSVLVWSFSDFLVTDAIDTSEIIFDYMLPYSFFFHFLIFFFSIGFGYHIDMRKDDALKGDLIQQNLKMELQLLKSQINPHFLFNTLNNIYALVRKVDDPTARNSIGQLSRLMRYMIYESNTETVPLEQEIDYIKDYLSLQKLRLPNPDVVVFSENLTSDHLANIAPMLLIPFVENAFKHGIGGKDDSIMIDIAFVENQLTFQVKNNIYPSQTPEEYQGFGLTNVKKRLELIYENRFKLDVKENGCYIVRLQLNLDK